MKNFSDRLITYLDKYEYISFDIFDTLIKRYVSQPEDVFILVEKKYNILTNNEVSGFVQKRKKAERDARMLSHYNEITLDEIYDQLPYSIDIKSELKSIEISIEMNVCITNHSIVNVFRELVNRGKKIYLISDMYLPEAIISEILNKCNIYGYERLYLSSTYRCRKRNGLFQKFISNEQLTGKSVAHVGDSVRSDYVAALRSGYGIIHPFHISKRSMRYPYMSRGIKKGSLYADMMDNFINLHLDKAANTFFQIGYAVYGPLLYAFVRWLVREVKETGCTKILFLARDAYIIQKAFHLIYSGDVKDYYFCLSRNSTLGTRLKGNYSRENVMGAVFKRTVFSLDVLLKRINAYSIDNVKMADAMGICLDDTITNIEDLGEKEIAYLDTVISNMQPCFSMSATFFEKYLNQFVKTGDRIAIVDIGWNGTAQSAIESAKDKLNILAEIYGYYIGINTIKQGREKNIFMKGFFVGENSLKQNRCYMKLVMGLLELFLTAPYGMTIGYEKQNDSVVPVFQNSQNQNQEDEDKILQMQEGALRFVQELNETGISDYLEIDPMDAMTPLINLCKTPKYNDLIQLGNIGFLEGKLNSVANPKSIGYYLMHPRMLKIDFGNSTWKLGYMRRLFHNFPMPYYLIYCVLLKIFEKV